MKGLNCGRACRAAGALALWAASAMASAQAPTSIEDFFRGPAIDSADLSPSGRYLAIIVGSPGQRTGLAVLDLDQRDLAAKGVARFADADIAGVHWVDDQRLVFSASDSDAPVDRRRARGLWAANRDGGEMRQLIKRTWTETISEGNTRINKRLLEPDHFFAGVVPDGSGDIEVVRQRWNNVGDAQGQVIYRLDTRTGAIRAAGTPPDSFVDHWVTDAKGEPRAAVSQSGGRARVYWRKPADTAWTLLLDEPASLGPPIVPLWIDGDTLYVKARQGADGTSALFRYDVEARKLDAEPLFRIDGFDYGGNREFDLGNGSTVGIHYEADAAGSVWFDAALAAAQTEVDALLPGRINRLSCTRCIGVPRLLVRSHSDRQPPVFYVFDMKSRKLEGVGASRPWIDSKQMAEQDFVRIKARDGRSIPVYVTRPRGKSAGPRPAVVLVHGGPMVRGQVWGWDEQAQFLASRGYVVIEPEFRGSDGFGAAHRDAGFKQWGLAMQDDVTDATLWAVKEAGVDAKRICIAGASYGGYAALMGVLREPELYRCAINWVGVTDPGLMFSLNHSDLDEDWKRYGLRTVLGDPAQDKERFAATSPLAQAARITRPLLMAYGGADRRVPIEHGTRFRDAVTRHNKDVEWVVYGAEGHGWGDPKNVSDFWARVEKFLVRHLAVPAALATAPASAAR